LTFPNCFQNSNATLFFALKSADAQYAKAIFVSTENGIPVHSTMFFVGVSSISSLSEMLDIHYHQLLVIINFGFRYPLIAQKFLKCLIDADDLIWFELV